MTATILGMRGWECGNSMLNSVDASDIVKVSASTSYAKSGTYSLRIGDAGAPASWARWRFQGAPSDPAVSCWMYLRDRYDSDGTGTVNHNIRFRLTTTEYNELRWNASTHTYDAYVNGVLFKAGTVEVSVNTWFHVQVHLTLADAGNITVLIDGHQSINQNGDTQPSAAAGCEYVYITGGSHFSGYDYIDNLVWGYGGLLGDQRVYDKRPNADTALIEWTPSTGASNYALEDETPQSDTDYNEAATDGLQDEFELSALDITGKTCSAVLPWARAKMEDGVGDKIYIGIDSNGTDSVNLSNLSTSWEYYFGNCENVDPADSAAWNQAKLDALLSRKVSVIT